MKKTLKAAVALSVLSAPAYAANLENPLYMPSQGSVYSKTSVGVMYKIADDTEAMVKKNHDGATEFPIWRLHEELGYGILDNLELYLKVGYTHDDDIARKGMHQGRAGLKYRALDTDGWVWDLYADAHLGGVSEMSGSYTATGFNYDNYSNGRWGFHVGTQVGKQIDKFSFAGFVEALRTFGNDNNSIDVSSMAALANAQATSTANAMGYPGKITMLPDEISVDLKSTTEINAGLKAFYQLNDKWSFGGGLTYKHHSDNGVEGLATDLPVINTGVAPLDAGMTAKQQETVNGLLAIVEDMEDGFDEYIIGLSAAYQMTDATQVALYGEYTFDSSHSQSQNGTDVKAELGVRLNVQF